MKKTFTILIFASCVFGCAQQRGCVQQRAAKAPFDLPHGVVHETDDRIEFHSFRWGTNDTTALFMMYPHPAGLNLAMVERMAEQASSHLAAAMRDSDGVAEVETTTDDVSAGAFTGKAIVCKVIRDDEEISYQTMYILWDGDRLWQGQLTATTVDDLEMVETILRSRTSDLRTTR